MRRPNQIPRTTEFSWGQVRAAVKPSLAWPLSPCVLEWGFSLLKKGCIFLIYKKALYGQSLATQCGLWVRSISITGYLLEMQDPRPNPRPLASEPVLRKIPR